METRKTPLALTASALAMALMLVGCGGGSSSSTPQPTVAAATGNGNGGEKEEVQAPTPTPVTLPTDTQRPTDYMPPMAGMMKVAAGGTWNPKDSDGMASDIVFSCPAGGEACDITVAADGTVTSTGGAATAALTMAAAERLDTEKTMMAAEMKGRAMGLFDALTDTTATRGRNIRGGTSSGLTITRGMSGDAMVSVGGQSGWETKAAGMSISDPWKGMTLSRKTHSYTVYTNIDPAKRKAFSKEYNVDGTADAYTARQITVGGNAVGITVNPVEDDSNINNESPYRTLTAADKTANYMPYHLALTKAGIEYAAGKGWLSADGFPQPGDPGAGDNKYTYDNSGNNKKVKFTGTFHGADGTYECTSPPCTLTAKAPSTASGPSYEAGSGNTWTFTPDQKNNPGVVAQDADHLHFGWWVNSPTKAGDSGQYLYDAQVFASGSLSFPTGLFNALHGEATYKGPAVGLFAIKEDAKNEIAAAYGEFSATAELTADFETTDAGTIKGTIGTFVRSDNVANEWKLTLDKMAASASGGAGRIVDGNSVIGGWNYAFYGSGKTAKGADGERPTGIAGTFDAKITGEDKSVAAVAGAFGATRQ